MRSMRVKWAVGLIAAAGLAACHPVASHRASLHGGGHDGAHAGLHASKGETSTIQLQGNDAATWAADPNMQALYQATREAFANGPDKVDVSAYEARAKAIFNDFAASRGVDAAAMQDHLKAIPMQMVQIAREDPRVLDSYENFRVALFGPD